GRGALDTKSLLAAEMAVMVEIRRRNLKLDRDLILVSEADEEAGSAGIHWLMQHAWTKIDAEFALNEGGTVVETGDGTRLFEIQTAEKIPMRLRLIARGTAAHASLPRADNPVEALSEAIVRLSKADEPVHWNPTTRRYFRALAKIPEYAWLGPLVPRLNTPGMAQAASRQIRMRDADLDAMLHTTVSATMLRAGTKLNVIPNAAEAELDVRRMPSETREEVLARFRQIVNNPAIAIDLAPGPQMPAAGPSSASSPLYRAMERAVARLYPGDAVVTPYMSRGATDGSYLRARGMPVYGVPLFLREPGESRVHGNDERIATKSLENGVELLWQIVLETAGAN
ncbi:MAG TPA: M20/M25/M40 family metallo-hydrolase, partial [Bryobacteraceae bacterium]|nr:M20/M25/M40 family metallo-hydrolase [Bryobacteraceae bacterium]